MESPSHKEKFDKKKWRNKKYNKKIHLEQWEEKKKHVLRSKLNKQLKKENGNDATHLGAKLLSKLQQQDYQPQKKTFSRVKKAQDQFTKKQQEKAKIKQELSNKKEEINRALEQYKKKKMQNFQILSKKTKKGQPVMRGRMQLLFEQVKKTVNSPK